MRIVVTGSDGFIGRNLLLRLNEMGFSDVSAITRATSPTAMATFLGEADFVFHLAGVNRPTKESEFIEGNVGYTTEICAILRDAHRPVPIVLSSSTQATRDTPYGLSKLAAEGVVTEYADACGASAHVFRLPNVFGKWARPEYNSAVATFCHNLARGLPIKVHDASAPLTLAYVDDVVRAMTGLLPPPQESSGFREVSPIYDTTVGEVARELQEIATDRTAVTVPRTGAGLTRALYATYLSYLPVDALTYELKRHEDARGMFAEVVRTPDSGQVSFFTAKPGVLRGEHYHHTKTEKFVVVGGTAQFSFRHVVTNETYAVKVDAHEARVVETAPGWAHSIRNIGAEELVVMIWANETFDPANPDTFLSPAES